MPPKPGQGSGCEPIPEKFLMHDVYAYPLLTSLRAQGFYRGWAGEGTPPPGNIVLVWSHPGPRSRERTGLIVGPLYPSRLVRTNISIGRGGVLLSSIKWGTHPDIRSLLPPLIG